MAKPVRSGKYYRSTMTGRIVYDRRIHTFSLRDVIRILKTLNPEFHDIFLVQEIIESFWDAFRRWFEGLLGWVREKSGLVLVKWILKFFCRNHISILRNIYPWDKEDLADVDAARDLIDHL